MQVSFQIENYWALFLGFGGDAAGAAIEALESQVRLFGGQICAREVDTCFVNFPHASNHSDASQARWRRDVRTQLGVLLFTWGRDACGLISTVTICFQDNFDRPDTRLTSNKSVAHHVRGYFEWPKCVSASLTLLKAPKDVVMLAQAFKEQKFSFAFQPVIEMKAALQGGRRTLFHEALLRGDFLSNGSDLEQIFEETTARGMMRWIDHSVVHAVLDYLNSDDQAVVSCNISSSSAIVDGWWEGVLYRLQKSSSLSRRLILEITEQVPISNAANVCEFTHTFRQLGVRVGLDDFGSNSSSLGYALAYPIDFIKIDRSILHKARRGGKAKEQLRALVVLAKLLTPTVVLEGVETNFDESLCWPWATAVQGYLYGKPEAVCANPNFGLRNS